MVRRWLGLVTLCSAAAVQIVSSQKYSEDTTADQFSRRLEVATVNSDEYAESVLTVKQTDTPKYGIGANVYTKLSSVLSMTMEMIETAKLLLQNERTLKEGTKMMEHANTMFREVMDRIQQIKADGDSESTNSLLRKKYSDEDIIKMEEDGRRALELSRQLYATMITFPECIRHLFADCLSKINEDIAKLGLSTIEVVVHEKRKGHEEGYNKVVLITNELADTVVGRVGDGIVTYPFLWEDSELGPRMLGVDGKWNCLGLTPDKCCDDIKQSVPNPDTKGNYIECHMFVPYGGIGNPRRSDRVFITLSPDGRVHEPPIIQ